ncbi:MAG: hypothetical protein M1816_001471 [Peltula sp. TS41687]|nr:MAG: hypothetical protein M1816_001471 [Peltula sp. TS41687]
MGYDWDDKEQLCYQMYIEEKRSLEDIMDYMRTQHGFNPSLLYTTTCFLTLTITDNPADPVDSDSKRAFQTQFKRWDFPSKQNPAHRNEPLVARVKELWEHNTSQKDMLRILQEEGHDIKERELMRVRAKHRWLLRVPNGMKPLADDPTPKNNNNTNTNGEFNELEQVLMDDHANGLPSADETNGVSAPLLRPSSPGLTPEVIAKRQKRMQELQQESAERWAARKRRRRTRGWAGLPADPPGPPRFPSETTIDESKAFLSLTGEAYSDIRSRFQTICEEGGFVKKTVAGPERWQAAKDRLIQEIPHLQSVFWGSNAQLESKALALDVLCSDVTKRMRTMEKRMTIADAKNTLGINPEQSRDVRNAFYNTLKADHFTSKLEAGDDHWKELKDQWIQGSPLLTQILAAGAADPDHAQKLRAIEVLCRDVMKRLRDDQTKRDPSKKNQRSSAYTATPPAPKPATRRNHPTQAPPVVNPVTAPAPVPGPGPVDHGDLQIDPSLLLAANNPSLVMDPHQQAFAHPFVPSTAYPPRPSNALPVYFRLSNTSQVSHNLKLWLATLNSISVHELRQLATSKHPNTICVRIDGIVRDETGNEVSFPIDEDDELEAYMGHVAGGKATFNVQLMPTYA